MKAGRLSSFTTLALDARVPGWVMPQKMVVEPDVYGRYYKVLRNCFLLIVEGTIQRQGGILNALAEGAVGMR